MGGATLLVNRGGLRDNALESTLGEKKVERLISQQNFGLRGPDALSYQGSLQGGGGGERVKSLGPLSQGSQRGGMYGGGDVLD